MYITIKSYIKGIIICNVDISVLGIALLFFQEFDKPLFLDKNISLKYLAVA